MAELEGQTANPSPESASEATASQPFWETMDDESAQQNPEPGAEESTQESPTVADEAENTEQEAETDYLPTEQEKVFPIETLAKYGKRYGYTLEEIQADPRIQNALKDKINSDILIQQQKEAQQQEEVEEPTQDEAEQPQPSQTAQTPEQRQQWLEQVVTQGIDQKSVEKFGYDFLVAAGVDPNNPENKSVLANAPNVGKALALGATDLITTLLPQMLPQLLPNLIEQQYPKFGEMHGRTLYQLAWDSVRTSNPNFSNLPTYGNDLKGAIEQAQKSIPNFDKVASQIQNAPGSQFEKAVSLYSLLASHMAGQKVTPQQVKQAIETGKKTVKDAERSRAAGKVLGAGQGNKTFAPGNKSEEFRSWIQEFNESQRSTPIKG